MATISEALAVAVRYHQAGHVGDAEQIYRQIVQADPNHAEAWCYLGILYLGRGLLDNAAGCCRQALALRPDFTLAHNSLAQVLGRKDQASANNGVSEQENCAPADAPEAHLVNQQAITLARQGKLQEAEAGFRHALRLKPDHAEYHSNLGNTLFYQRKYDEAIVCYQEALRLWPDFANAYSNLANVFKEQGRIDDAIANYRHALQLDPNLADAYNNLGATLADQGDFEQAAASYQRGLRSSPTTCRCAPAWLTCSGRWAIWRKPWPTVRKRCACGQIPPRPLTRLGISPRTKAIRTRPWPTIKKPFS